MRKLILYGFWAGQYDSAARMFNNKTWDKMPNSFEDYMTTRLVCKI